MSRLMRISDNTVRLRTSATPSGVGKGRTAPAGHLTGVQRAVHYCTQSSRGIRDAATELWEEAAEYDEPDVLVTISSSWLARKPRCGHVGLWGAFAEAHGILPGEVVEERDKP